MVVLELHSQNIKARYKNYLCSKTTLIVWVINLVKLAFPFILCYSTQGFWRKNDVFFEQPDLRFKGEYLFIGHTNNVSFPIICSNLKQYQNLHDQDHCMLIKVREIDWNYDGRVDEFFFKMILVLPQNINILFVDIFIPIDYQLHTICAINIETAIFIQEIISSSINVMNITSILRLFQKSPLPCYPNHFSTYFNHYYDEDTLNPRTISDLVNNYNKRNNLTTYLSHTHKTFEIQRVDRFEINLNIVYPEHKIHYKTGFLQILKFAWMQYLSIYIVFSWLTRIIKNHIFDNGLVLFYKISPIKDNL